MPGLDLQLHDAVTRRLAWGDSEEVVLADAETVFDRLMVAVERALRDPADRMVVIEAATQVAVTVARVVSLAAVGRASRDRAARLREEMAQRQLKEVLEKQRASIVRLELEDAGLKRGRARALQLAAFVRRTPRSPLAAAALVGSLVRSRPSAQGDGEG